MFKWTEDASREAGLRASGSGFAIDLPQARAADWFPTGAVVEVIADARARAGLVGPMGTITSAPGAQLAINGVAASELGATVRVRRWAAMPAPIPAAAAWVPLSKGVRVRFSSGAYVAGAAWTIPARTVLGDIAWPPYANPDKTEAVGGSPVGFYAPLEGQRYHAALALIRRNGGNYVVTQDLRGLFPPLTDLTADTVRFDDSNAHLGATNVQQAIDELARREGDCCTWHAKPAMNLQALVDAIPARANGTLCLGTGNYQLNVPLRVAGKGHIRVIGVGSGTKLWCRTGPQALVFEDCLSVEVADLLATAESPGTATKVGHTGGAVDVSGSGPVRITRSTLIAQGTRWRQSAALRIAGSTVPGGGDISITDCDIVAGDLATGLLVTGAQVLRVADNRIRTRSEPVAATLRRWAEDKTMAAAVGRLAISHAVDAAARARPATRIDARLFSDRQLTVANAPLNFFASNLVAPAGLTGLPALLAREDPNGNSRSYRLRMRRIASTILVQSGRPRIAGTIFNGFQGFYNMVRGLIAPSMDSAIVVGGTFARDIRISGNRIDGALRGIRVAVNAGLAQQRIPLGTVRIEGNVIRLRVVPTDVVRVGIFVGNAERTWIVDNDVAGETSDPEFSDNRTVALRQQHFDALHAEGVRVFGVLGPMIQIRGNMVRGCPFAFTVTRASGTDGRAKLWLLQGNYAEGGVTPYRTDAACRKIDCI
jgi:hypothetical protein